MSDEGSLIENLSGDKLEEWRRYPPQSCAQIWKLAISAVLGFKGRKDTCYYTQAVYSDLKYVNAGHWA